jgi:tetratricopeptide (TPR) repeat protein
MNRISLFLSTTIISSIFLPIPLAQAEGLTLKVRGQDKENYTRLVFDGGQGSTITFPNYDAQLDKNKISIIFDKNINISPLQSSLKSLTRISAYETVSPHSVVIKYPEGQVIRHFTAGNKLIVDIQGKKIEDIVEAAAGEADKSVVEESQLTKQQENLEDIQKKLEPNKNIIVDDKAAKEEADKPVVGGEKSLAHTLTITSTKSNPLGVFRRNQYLWVVQGKDAVSPAPSMDKKAIEALGDFERIENSDASIYRLKIPDSAQISASGGGLVWKINIGGHEESKKTPLKILKSSQDNVTQAEWPAASLNRLISIQDPDSQDTIYVALVEEATDFSGNRKSYIDFEKLESPVGSAFITKRDDLKIMKEGSKLIISSPQGVQIAPDKDIAALEKQKKADSIDNNQEKILFQFSDWKVGEAHELPQNQRLIMANLGDQNEVRKASSIIELAKLALSFNYAHEAIGYLQLAQSMVPELDGNPEYIGLLAAAEALAGKPKEAFKLFNNASLNDYPEISFWRSFTLAELDDWQQAAKVLPEEPLFISSYTNEVKIPLMLNLTEVALREGNIPKAEKFFETLEPLREKMFLPHASAYDYLRGEMLRQQGKSEETKEIWQELMKGPDDLYRAKSRFALTMMQLDSKEITVDKAIDNLEGLRYAWRGDDLEVSINYNLAKIYLQKNDPIKALTLMNLAHSLNPESEKGKIINADMKQTFQDLFKPEKIKDISPVDVLILYNEFSKLIPSGVEGEVLTRQLAERMADADLIPRAVAVLKKQLSDGLKGKDAVDVSVRLATLNIMDAKPDEALASLNTAETLLAGLPEDYVLAKQNDISLLRAKSYSLKGNADEAFAALELVAETEDSLRLKADIAWRAKKWQDAAEALEQLVQNQEISLTRPLTDTQADLLLNWAVALYLADNRYVLANLRERYSDAMAATPRAQKFEVVTRPRQGSLLSDRETINSIIDETTIFKDFLTSFKATDVGAISNKNASAKPAANIPEEIKNIPNTQTDNVTGE